MRRPACINRYRRQSLDIFVLINDTQTRHRDYDMYSYAVTRNKTLTSLFFLGWGVCPASSDTGLSTPPFPRLGDSILKGASNGFLDF